MKNFFTGFLLLALSLAFLSCSRLKGERTQLTQTEAARIEEVVAKFNSRMNQEQYGQIWEDMLPFLKGSKTDYSQYLGGIQNKYGAIRNYKLLKVEVRPYEEEAQKNVVECWYEIESEKGKYVDWFVWHLIEHDYKLAFHQLLEYDEQDKLYMTMTLHKGLGPNDKEDHKIPLGNIGESSK